jgi:hypothetical protein
LPKLQQEGDFFYHGMTRPVWWLILQWQDSVHPLPSRI